MENIIENAPTFFNLIIAAAVAFIAYQQYMLAKFNTRRELYNRRIPIFKSVMKYISKVIIDTDINKDDGFQLLKETSETNFLFEPDVKNFIDELYKKGIELNKTNKKMEYLLKKDSNDKEYQKYCLENKELLLWFSEQFKEADKIFGKYLRIDKS